MTANLNTNVAQLCDRLLEAYRAKGLDFAASLEPALSGEDIARIASSAGLELAPELQALYQWHNGSADSSGEEFLIAGKTFLPLETAVKQREAMLAALHPKDRANLDEGLLPFAMSEHEWYAIAKASEGGVRPVFLVVEDAQPDFESLEAMLRTSIAWVEEADWSPNSPPARAKDIWYEHNPNMDD